MTDEALVAQVSGAMLCVLDKQPFVRVSAETVAELAEAAIAAMPDADRIAELEARIEELRPLAMVGERMVERYLADRPRIAAVCDELLDRSGGLLGHLRAAAALTYHKDQSHEG